MNPHAKLNVAVSSSALFDLTEADQVFRKDGLGVYRAFQLDRVAEPLKPGPAFGVIKALSSIKDKEGNLLVNIQMVSRNCLVSGLRILHSMRHHGIHVDRAAFTGGVTQMEYLKAYQTDLFLSTNNEDVLSALKLGYAAARIYPNIHTMDVDQLRLAFDGDCVLFSEEAEKVYTEQGFDSFVEHEVLHENRPLPAGPFFKFLARLHDVQKSFSGSVCPIRTALVTARSFPTHIRPITTLLHWGIHIDECFFLAGNDKTGVLSVFRPHLFFDDQTKYCDKAAPFVPTAQVPNIVTAKNGT